MAELAGLHGELFADHEFAALFEDQASLQGMLDFEAALAKAQAETGVIPAAAAEAIARVCEAGLYDIPAIGRAATLAGNPAIPLVKALTARVAATDPEAAKWVHFGATSQDVIDSGQAQQYRAAWELLLERSARLAHALAGLVREHRRTPMIGRTFLQHAVPIAFGLKAANWLGPVVAFHDDFMIWGQSAHQLGGAAGSLAALGDKADAVSEAFARIMPSIGAVRVPWHSERRRPARIATELGLLLGHLGKMAGDIALMAQTEIGELAEPEAPGKGGSSAMPHKRNPVLCTLILAAAKRAPGLVSTMLAAMPQEHERAMGGWHAEWLTLRELFLIAGAALNQAVTLIEGLQVFPEQMQYNLDLTNGLVMAERVSLALAQTIGRGEAHHLLEEASRDCIASGRHLKDVLADHPALAGRLSPEALDDLFDPTTYRGATDAIIDRVLVLYEEEREYMSGNG
ncbi:3-carboxy-cis,cis-muconate cycloisomerase [Bosea sp. (in: a-proteobacteria)]|uniref:3-carboxy-cis,cis-muconate cycloisomerase n=1 Tax=Bosea sp. (in: a-proteobacteria) TaxID=1871050 RepID=UPI00086A2120|nr:3-carboxy-cis,cis-muconate cycloisomerase [Bosea sp. (in: a-proteobacteria)]MBN9438612.1 3-carboxy-cis,cis-muconate cycloisomerase [Bosea sp. (in: a-proteobacteria)]ODT49335.1 MAG: 3-carboxy-cis,cis-muconate cycloisomerase [Methylobacterium sp. SCN 67-24]